MQCNLCIGTGLMKRTNKKCENCLQTDIIKRCLCENCKKYGKYILCNQCFGTGIKSPNKSRKS